MRWLIESWGEWKKPRWLVTADPVRPVAAAVVALAFLLSGTASRAASDPGKKACAAEARKLCPAEMRTFSRKKVEACMIAHIDQTSPTCHAAMLRIKAEREAAGKPGPRDGP